MYIVAIPPQVVTNFYSTCLTIPLQPILMSCCTFQVMPSSHLCSYKINYLFNYELPFTKFQAKAFCNLFYVYSSIMFTTFVLCNFHHKIKKNLLKIILCLVLFKRAWSRILYYRTLSIAQGVDNKIQGFQLLGHDFLQIVTLRL